MFFLIRITRETKRPNLRAPAAIQRSASSFWCVAQSVRRPQLGSQRDVFLARFHKKNAKVYIDHVAQMSKLFFGQNEIVYICLYRSFRNFNMYAQKKTEASSYQWDWFANFQFDRSSSLFKFQKFVIYMFPQVVNSCHRRIIQATPSSMGLNYFLRDLDLSEIYI